MLSYISTLKDTFYLVSSCSLRHIAQYFAHSVASISVKWENRCLLDRCVTSPPLVLWGVWGLFPLFCEAPGKMIECQGKKRIHRLLPPGYLIRWCYKCLWYQACTAQAQDDIKGAYDTRVGVSRLGKAALCPQPCSPRAGSHTASPQPWVSSTLLLGPHALCCYWC